MKKFLLAAAAVLLIFSGFFLSIFLKEYKEMDAIDKSPVDISEVKDGVYEGYCETTLVKVRVKVTVSSGRIENIEILEHQCGKGLPANVITDDIVSQNDIEVDAVTGATVSSEAIKAAVRDALRKGS